jgi:hypothetical protein
METLTSVESSKTGRCLILKAQNLQNMESMGKTINLEKNGK